MQSGQSSTFKKWGFRPSCCRMAELVPGIRQVSESRCKASVSEGGRLVENWMLWCRHRTYVESRGLTRLPFVTRPTPASTGPRFGKRGDRGRADACHGAVLSQSRDRLLLTEPDKGMPPPRGHGISSASITCNMRATPGDSRVTRALASVQLSKIHGHAGHALKNEARGIHGHVGDPQ